MGFFDHLQKGGGFSLQAKKPQIRQVVQTRPAPPSRSSSQPSNRPTPRPVPAESQRKTRDFLSTSASGERDYSSKRRLTPLRNRKRPTPEQRLSSDDDDGSDTDTSFDIRKRARTGDSSEPDYGRRLRSLKAFSGDGTRALPMVHAAKLTSGDKAAKFSPAFGSTGQRAEILLQYPSATPKERCG
jgi:H3 lysine-79-specific histone-lysine N-methyltransferase